MNPLSIPLDRLGVSPGLESLLRGSHGHIHVRRIG